MATPHSFHPGALRELHEAFDWYAERNDELARDFVIEIQSILERIGEFPDSGSPLPGDGRVVNVPRFPYQVVYLQEASLKFVIAISHTSRRPGYWRDRLPPT